MQSLTNLYTKKPHTMAFVIQYLLGRSTTVLEILYQLNLIGRSSEMARIFGMDFESVISRGIFLKMKKKKTTRSYL